MKAVMKVKVTANQLKTREMPRCYLFSCLLIEMLILDLIVLLNKTAELSNCDCFFFNYYLG